MTEATPEAKKTVEAGAAALFDQWAENGRDCSMADGHRDVTGQLLDRWTLTADHAVLDVGCGNGWAVRWMRDRGAGSGTGVDVSPEMIERAKRLHGDDHTRFFVAGADALPFDDGAFSHLLSVESLYYYPDPQTALAEWARVTRPGGRLGVIVDLYRENPATHNWIDALGIPVHLLSEAELAEMAVRAGWHTPRTVRLIDRRPPRPEADFSPSPYWPDYQTYLDYRACGSLALLAERPPLAPGRPAD